MNIPDQGRDWRGRGFARNVSPYFAVWRCIIERSGLRFWTEGLYYSYLFLRRAQGTSTIVSTGCLTMVSITYLILSTFRTILL